MQKILDHSGSGDCAHLAETRMAGNQAKVLNQALKYSETEVGTKSDQNLATGQVLYQKHLGTAATLIKGGTQEAKFQRLLSLELHATQKRLDRPEGEEGMPEDGV